ncbi:ferredoxin [Saccharopolyspora sp. 5N708]|uniref:ferredoxin n=1 Tax=Saccharopolyspora sp. 5N708 TaxID=3457424 RepID=UPI003FD10DA6
MRIHADGQFCVSSGMCVLTLPEIFDQDEDDGRVIVRNPVPAAEFHDTLREAVMLCPSHALSLRENPRSC